MPFDVVIVPFLQLVLSCIKLYRTLIFIYIIISLLLSFNIVNRGNVIVYSMYSVLDRLIEPLLRPIKRVLPSIGIFDFSVVVLILGLQFVSSVISMTILKYFGG
jgi:YggT family protein